MFKSFLMKAIVRILGKDEAKSASELTKTDLSRT
jgi:hypothetical protein